VLKVINEIKFVRVAVSQLKARNQIKIVTHGLMHPCLQSKTATDREHVQQVPKAGKIAT
jgi:hypothetical protein